MNTDALIALLRREWRQRRGLLAVLMLAGPALSVGIQYLALEPGDETLTAHFLLPALLAVCWSIWSADLGSRDAEQRTARSLSRLPVSRWELLVAQLLMLIAGGILLAASLLGFELAWRQAFGWPGQILLANWLLIPTPVLVGTLVALGSWSLAITLGRTLAAVLLAPLLFLVLPLGLAQLIRSEPLIDESFHRLSWNTSTWLAVGWVAVGSLAALAAGCCSYSPAWGRPLGRGLRAILASGLILVTSSASAYAWISSSRPFYTTVVADPTGTSLLVLEYSQQTDWLPEHRRRWVVPLDSTSRRDARRLDGSPLWGSTTMWTPSGELIYHPEEARKFHALDLETGASRELADLSEARWWVNKRGESTRSVIWQDHELSVPEECGFLRPLPTEPGLVAWLDQDNTEVYVQRLDEAEPRVLATGTGVHGLRVSPYAPLLCYSVEDQLVYQHALTGEVLARPEGSHRSWSNQGEFVAVSCPYSPDEQKVFLLIGPETPTVLSLPNRQVDDLVIVGPERVVTWSSTEPVTLRDLQGRPLSVIWD